MSPPYCFTVTFSICDNDLDAQLNLPQNFLAIEPLKQVSIIHGLREQFRGMDIAGLDITSSYNADDNKQQLISNYADLFPLESHIRVDYNKTTKSHCISLRHDFGMNKIPQIQQPAFVALVIAALTAAGTLIVSGHEGLIK